MGLAAGTNPSYCFCGVDFGWGYIICSLMTVATELLLHSQFFNPGSTAFCPSRRAKKINGAVTILWYVFQNCINVFSRR